MTKTPTTKQSAALQKAFDHFNKTLFMDALPHVVLTLSREKARRLGYFWCKAWRDTNDDKQRVDEISLNPGHVRKDNIRKVLSTLVHEMVHLQQEYFGEQKPKRGYHNKEWSEMMELIGLIPSDTGKEGGKKTGQQMTHYIADGGRFDVACEALLSKKFIIPYGDATMMPAGSGGADGSGGDTEEGGEKEAKRKSKSKFTCPGCECNAWGKEDLNLKCGECDMTMELA